MYSHLFRLQAKLLKTLAEPKRLEIIHLLREHRMTVTEIYSMMDLSQANVSQHLMVLRKAGLVESEKIGKLRYYSLVDSQILAASDSIREWLLNREHVNNRSEDFLSLEELLKPVIDPICGMQITPKTAAYSHRTDTETVYFCASGCWKQYLERLPNDDKAK